MCSFVILAGNWVLLICVWGCRFCSNIAHMHIKLLYELNTCLRLRSSSSSLACCLKKTPKPDSLNNWNGHTAVPSPHLVPSLPVDLAVTWWQMVQIRCVCQPSETYRGKHADELFTDFTRHSDCYQSNVTLQLLIFFLMFYQLRLFFSVSSFDWPYLPVFPSPSLFNNNLLSSFILLVMISSSIIALCSFPISDISDGFLSSFPPPFLSPFCLLCAALLVSVHTGSGSSLWVCVAGLLTVTACLELEWHIN